MKKLILAGYASGLWLFTTVGLAQPTVYFANTGPGWAGPWYGGYRTEVHYSDASPHIVGIGNTPLPGPGFTAELWAGPESASDWQLQPLRQTVFRTGALAGLFVTPVSPTPVPFAQAGERIAYQLRVWDNVGGTITSWAQLFTSPSGALFGTTEVYLSPPLSTDTTTPLEFRDGHVLTIDGPAFPALRLPVVSFSTDGTNKYLARGLYAGDTITLAVECPNPVATVQWSFQGTNLSGRTNLTLALPNIGAAQSGLYSVAVTAVVGSRVATMTNTVSLSILSPPRLVEPRLHPQQGFSAAIEGVTNRFVQIDFGSDLVAWTAWHTQYVGRDFNPACTGLCHSFTNSFPLPATARFYRARVLP